MATPIHTFIKGERFVANNLLTKSRTEEVQRTWKERLFSWPWRPLKTTKYVTTQVPSRDVLYSQGTYFAHPDLIAEIARAAEGGGCKCDGDRVWTEESASNNWRSSCTKCGTKAQGSCQA